MAEPWVANAEAGEQPEVAWPGRRCRVPNSARAWVWAATGDGAHRRGAANAATPWVSDGKRWTVALRPLLPDETDCGDLVGNR